MIGLYVASAIYIAVLHAVARQIQLAEERAARRRRERARFR